MTGFFRALRVPSCLNQLRTRKGACSLFMVGLVALSANISFGGTLPFTFGQFEQASTPGFTNVFAYNDNGVGHDAEFVTQGSLPGAGPTISIPVIFSFENLGSLPADLSGPLNATLTLTSSTVDPVVTGFGGTQGLQTFNGSGLLNDALSITLDVPAAEGGGTRTNLLTMDFTGGLLGEINGLTPSMSGNTNLGDTITYTSDFLTFKPPETNNFSLTFTSWVSTGDGGGLEIDSLDNYYNSATAQGVGTFDTSVGVSFPEPSGWMLAAFSALSLLAGRKARRLGIGA